MPRLVVNPRSPAPWEIQLKSGTNLIGRGFANDFRIEDPSVSGSHCQILVENGDAYIKDLGSTNGTFINRAPVKDAPLRPGQTIHLGAVEVEFHADATAGAEVADTVVLRRPPPPIAVAAAVPTAAPAPIRIVPTQLSPAGGAAPPPVAVAAPAVRITGRPVAAAVAHPPTPPPSFSAPAAALIEEGVGAPQQCKFHPKTLGRYFCSHCHHAFCELCIASRQAAGMQKKFCRQCGTELKALHVTAVVLRPVEKGFFARLPGAFVYPFKGSGVLVLIFGTILFACLNMFGTKTRYGYIPQSASWTLIFRVFALGYLFSFMQSIIHAAAVGEEEMPSLPSMANFWEDILLPCLQLLGLSLICFGPAIGVAWWAISSESSSLGPALIAAVVLGALYFPMAFLAVAMLDSVLAANPIQIVPSILKVPLEYLVTVILLAIVMGMRPLGEELIPLIFPRGLSTHNMAKLFGFLAASAFWSFFSLYLLTVAMRILGLLYLSKKEKLGWLDR